MLKLRTILVTTMAAALVACTSPPRVQTTNGPTAELNDRLQADDDGGRPRVFAVTGFIHERTGLAGKHHEIYLSDIRRADPAKWKTIIRQPMAD